MSNQPEGIKKAPRVIRIDDPARMMLIHQAMDGPTLTPDRIADSVVRFQRALDRQRQEQHDRIWTAISELYPDTQNGTWSFNPVNNTIVEVVDEDMKPEATPLVSGS